MLSLQRFLIALRQNRLVKRINFYRNRTNCELKMKGFLFFQKPEKRSHIYPEIGDILRIFYNVHRKIFSRITEIFPENARLQAVIFFVKLPQNSLFFNCFRREESGNWNGYQQKMASKPCRLLNSQNLPQMFFYELTAGHQISCNLPPK